MPSPSTKVLLCALILVVGSAPSVQAQVRQRGGVWVSFGLVGGPYRVHCEDCGLSSADRWTRGSDFALDFTLGGSLTRNLRLGMGMAGILAEPADGAHYLETLSIMLAAQYFPVADKQFWMRAALGYAQTYLKTGGVGAANFAAIGLSTQLAAGYDWRVGSFGFAPTAGFNLHAPMRNIYQRPGHPARVNWLHLGVAVAYY
jgi:hypothetical protein